MSPSVLLKVLAAIPGDLPLAKLATESKRSPLLRTFGQLLWLQERSAESLASHLGTCTLSITAHPKLLLDSIRPGLMSRLSFYRIGHTHRDELMKAAEALALRITTRVRDLPLEALDAYVLPELTDPFSTDIAAAPEALLGQLRQLLLTCATTLRALDLRVLRGAFISSPPLLSA